MVPQNPSYKMDLKIIQWNLNGFYTRQEFLLLLMMDYNPSVVCLQETNLKGSYCSKLKNYSLAFKNRANTEHASGGVATYIKKEIHFEEVKLNTNMEVVAVKILSDMEVCICNIYIPNWLSFNLQDQKNLISQLPKPVIIVGYFNSHNTLWGCRRTDPRGKTIDQLLRGSSTLLVQKIKFFFF